jgi:hypothetical protein
VAQASITINREGGWSDRLRKWRILIDGKEVGQMREGDTFRYEIPSGRHELVMKVDWASSETLPFEIAPGENVRVMCRPGRRFPFWRIRWSRWIELERVM